MEKKYLDKTKSLEERKLLYKEEVTDKMMNPINEKDFNKETFDPFLSGDETDELVKRKRVIPPKSLPTFDVNPKEIREGQMIGMYESKQDIYLTFAHRCNDMQKEINLLKEEINNLKNNFK